MDELYREYLLEHYKDPQNKGKIKNPDIHKYDVNVSCGDEVEIFIKLDKPHEDKDGSIDKRKITDIKFDGHGCVICMASASILTEEVLGKTIGEVKKMNTDSMLKLLQLNLTPTRIKCAMLPLVTIKKGVLEKESGPQENVKKQESK